MNQAFGCPSCQQRFQVAAEQAGLVVQCPSCARTVQIPIDAFPDIVTTQPPAPSPPQIFSCPSCQGQFGISPEMYGQQVGCPHCQTAVLIEAPGSSPGTQFEAPKIEASQIEAPIIETRKPQTGKRPKPDSKKSNLPKRWKEKSKPAEASPAQFAAGLDSKTMKDNKASAKTKSFPQQDTDKIEPKINPVRRSGKPKKTDMGLGKQDATPPSKTKPKSPSPVNSDLLPPGEKPTQAKKKRFQDPPSKPVKPKPVKPIAGAGSEEIVAEIVESPEELVQAYVVERVAVDLGASVSKNPRLPGSESISHAGLPPAAEEVDQPLPPGPNDPDPIDHLLPPVFNVYDPTRLRGKRSEQYEVMLPDGQGGTTQVDRRVVRVKHEGEQVSLVVSTRKEKQRRRMIQNIVAIIIGIAVLTAAFLLLR